MKFEYSISNKLLFLIIIIFIIKFELKLKYIIIILISSKIYFLHSIL